MAEVLATNINPENSQALSLLNNNLSFVDLQQLNLNDIKTNLSFEDGKVSVKPFQLKYKDIDIDIAGSHGLDQKMDYKAVFNVPAKYLGTEVTGLLNKLGESGDDISVPVTANILGNFANPSVKTDLKSSVSNLTSELVQRQKTKLVNQAVGKVLGNSDDENSTTSKVGNVLGGLLNKKKDTTSTTSNATNNNAVENVGNAINSLFKKKK